MVANQATNEEGQVGGFPLRGGGLGVDTEYYVGIEHRLK